MLICDAKWILHPRVHCTMKWKKHGDFETILIVVHPLPLPLQHSTLFLAIHFPLCCCHANIPGDGVVMTTEWEEKSADVW